MDKNILDYGANGNGTSLCTNAIQEAINECASSGGGRVIIPPGNYLSGTIWLKSHVELHLAQGALLKGSPDLNDYNDEDAYPQNASGRDEGWIGKHLILAVECEDIALTGNGKIDGCGDIFYGEPRYYDFVGKYGWRDGLARTREGDILRPGQVICFIECQHVRVENVMLYNAPCWGFFFHGCDMVTVHGIKVINNRTFENTDGIDIDCCSHVVVSDCIIDTGDDAIAIRANRKRLKNCEKCCEYITITNCILGTSGDAFRIGIGTGIIRHVRISNIVITRGTVGVEFSLDYLGNGRTCVEDIHFNGISAVGLSFPIILIGRNGSYARNISFEDIYVEAIAAIKIIALHENLFSDIALRNVTFQLEEGPEELTEEVRNHRGHYMIEALNVNIFSMENIHIKSNLEVAKKWTDIIKADACHNLIKHNIIEEFNEKEIYKL